MGPVVDTLTTAVDSSMMRLVPADGKDALKHALAERGWKQRALAKACGVSASTVCRWLSGERQPRKKHIRRLRELLEIPADAWV